MARSEAEVARLVSLQEQRKSCPHEQSKSRYRPALRKGASIARSFSLVVTSAPRHRALTVHFQGERPGDGKPKCVESCAYGPYQGQFPGGAVDGVHPYVIRIRIRHIGELIGRMDGDLARSQSCGY